ncbi:hypothetical protein D3C72_2097370 [compost metagenome]
MCQGITVFGLAHSLLSVSQLQFADAGDRLELHRARLTWQPKLTRQAGAVRQAHLDFINSAPLRSTRLDILTGNLLDLVQAKQSPGYVKTCNTGLAGRTAL